VKIVALAGIGSQIEDLVATVAEVVHVLEVTLEPGNAACVLVAGQIGFEQSRCWTPHEPARSAAP